MTSRIYLARRLEEQSYRKYIDITNATYVGTIEHGLFIY